MYEIHLLQIRYKLFLNQEKNWNKMRILLASIIALTFVSIVPFSFADHESYVLSHFSVKAKIQENNPFGGLIQWTIVNGESGTVVYSSQDGITVFRLSMTQSDDCEDPETVCLDSTITSIKNSQYQLVEVGDHVKMVFDMQDKQTITFQSGKLESLVLDLEIEKIRIKEISKIVQEEIKEEIEAKDEALQEQAWEKLLEAVLIATDSQVKQILTDSNEEFANLEDPIAVIDKRDEEWLATSDEEMTPFMESLIANKVSEYLRLEMSKDQQKPTDFVYKEIILTNSYGANVAQTGKTSDYKQWDEEWWIIAKHNGVHFERVFDESAKIDSMSMSVRIDEGGRFMGIMKFVINAEM